MGIPTLIKTLTASGSASLEFVDGASDVTLDSTYDEYMFVFTDINPATDAADFTFQVNATDGADYNDSAITSTVFRAYHRENDNNASLDYVTGEDQAQGTAFQILASAIGNDADQSCAGELHLFNPASTTYVKHFYARMSRYFPSGSGDGAGDHFAAGYINDTTAIDDIQFKFSSGNFDGVIQMYGIS